MVSHERGITSAVFVSHVGCNAVIISGGEQVQNNENSGTPGRLHCTSAMPKTKGEGPFG